MSAQRATAARSVALPRAALPAGWFPASRGDTCGSCWRVTSGQCLPSAGPRRTFAGPSPRTQSTALSRWRHKVPPSGVAGAGACLARAWHPEALPGAQPTFCPPQPEGPPDLGSETGTTETRRLYSDCKEVSTHCFSNSFPAVLTADREQGCSRPSFSPPGPQPLVPCKKARPCEAPAETLLCVTLPLPAGTCTSSWTADLEQPQVPACPLPNA